MPTLQAKSGLQVREGNLVIEQLALDAADANKSFGIAQRFGVGGAKLGVAGEGNLLHVPGAVHAASALDDEGLVVTTKG